MTTTVRVKVAASGNLLKLAVVELLEIESLSAGALQNQPSKKANKIMRRSYSARTYLSVVICLAANHAVLVKAQSETLRLPPKQAEQTIAGRARHESYPAAIIVEYHFPGFQEKYGGMDWTSL